MEFLPLSRETMTMLDCRPTEGKENQKWTKMDENENAMGRNERGKPTTNRNREKDGETP